MRPRQKAFLFLIIATFIWGLASVVIKATLSGIDVTSFLFYRFAISGVLAFFSLKKIMALTKKSTTIIGWVLAYCVFSTPVALGLLFAGLSQSTVLTLSVFSALGPVLLAVGGHFFFHEHLTHRQKVGAGIAVVGSAITILPEFYAHSGVGSTFLGTALLFLYIVVDVCSILILKKLLKKNIDATSLTNLSFIIGFLFLIPVVVLFQPNFFEIVTKLSIPVHLGVIYMAVFSGTIAYAIRAKAQKTIGLSEAGFMGYIVPVLSTLFAVLFLGEHITREFAFGAILIALGVILIEYKKQKASRKI